MSSPGRATPLLVSRSIPLAGLSQSLRMRVEHDAATLRAIGHPSIVAPTLRTTDAMIEVERPFIPGETLDTILARGPLTSRDGLALARAILGALAAAHARGVIHANLRPHNIVIPEGGGFADARLLDFGLARTRGAREPDSDVLRAQYIAPEQAGLLDHEVTERADLYVTGLVLYAALAGRFPFRGDSVREILRAHLTTRPPDLRTAGAHVPRVLDELVGRLLQKEPSARYQSAEAALVDVVAIDEALARGIHEPTPVLGAHDHRRTLAEPAFVARAHELAQLDGALERARNGQGALVLLEAESGGGKTRVLEESARRAQMAGAWILRGQGVDQAAQRPFQVLAGVAEDVAMRAKEDPTFAATLDARLAEERSAAIDALPLLGEAIGGATETLGPEAHAESRSVQALRAFLDALGDADRPAFILLDDAQWADDLTLKLLTRWSKTEGARYVTIVVAFRTEEAPKGHPLRSLSGQPQIRLPEFSETEVKALAESMAGPLPPEAVQLIARLSEGSPFMASAVLRGLVESGALVAGPAGWSVEATQLAEMRSSREAAAFLARRLRLLPAETLNTLSVGAVLGKEFGLDEASALSGLAASAAIQTLEPARLRHIVWARVDAGRYAFVHDKLRETLLAMMTPETRRDLHRRAALRLEGDATQRAFELAYHFDAAGEPQKALPYALAAARSARAQHALAIAEQQYRIAKAGAREESAAVQREVEEGLGEVLMLRGRYQDAAQSLEAARALATTPMEMAQIDAKIGELAFKRGDVAEASEALERGVRSLGRRVPRSSFGYLMFAIWEVLVQIGHSMFPRRLGKKPREGADEEFVAIRLYSRLAYAYWFQKGLVACGWAHLREMNLAEKYPASEELAQAYSEHAPVSTMIPWYSRGIRYVQRSYEIRKARGDIWGQGQSLHFYATVLYAATQYEECLKRSREAIRLLERTGDMWEVNTAMWHVAFCEHRLGRLAESVETARRLHAQGQELGDHQAAGISLGVWARASGGRVPPEIVAAERARPSDDVHTRAEVLMASALVADHAGDRDGAIAHLREAQRLIRAKGLRQEYVSPVAPWTATMIRAALDATPAYDPARRATLLREGRKEARRAVGIARFYKNNMPHALRERALFKALAGDARGARLDLNESLRYAEAQGARYERALTLVARGRVGAANGWPDHATDAAEGARECAAMMPAPVERTSEPTLSLADRFDSLLEQGRRVAARLTRDEAFATARDATRILLRADAVGVLLVEDGELKPLDEDAGAMRALADRALAQGRAVALTGDEADDITIAAGVRSALAVPIEARGRPVAVLYAAHRDVRDLYGDEELRVAEFVASLAGAALENAESHERVQFQNILLERQGEAAIDGILVVGRGGKILSHNRRFREMWSIPSEAMLAGRDEEALQGAIPQVHDPEAFISRVQWLYAHPNAESRDEVQLKDGRVFDRYSAPVGDADGEPARVWFFRDVTRERAAEKALRETNERLTEVTKLKTQLLNTASHELNTPLTPLKLQVHMLRNGSLGKLSPQQERAMALIDRNLGRLLTLVKDLLDVSRIEGGRLKIVATPLDVAPLLRESGEAFEASAREANVTLRIDATAPLPIRGDAGRLSQVAFNLLSNALKFTPAGGEVRVSATREKGEIVVRVRDTGTGLTAAQIAELFKPFSQVHDETHARAGGSGLGLYISKGIIDQHGGRIWAESDGPGHGTTFAFAIPAG